MERPFKALVVTEKTDGEFVREIRERRLGDLPAHDVLIRVCYSSLNYKDALSASGDKGVTRSYPHTPGIDAAGTVHTSRDDRFAEGDEVIVTGYGLGENTPGGFGEYICVPGDWVVPLPNHLTLRESMILGTAGFTAAYGLRKIRHNGTRPEEGEVLVTGATGGVGSIATLLLSSAGYRVTAATGKPERTGFLKELGADRIIGREEVNDATGKPLLHSRWSAVIDTVGGAILDTALRQTAHNGTVACCGNILGHELSTSIYPFILRGVSLMGIDSARCPMPTRQQIWDRMGRLADGELLNRVASEITLDGLDEEIKKILRGGQTGRIVINLNN